MTTRGLLLGISIFILGILFGVAIGQKVNTEGEIILFSGIVLVVSGIITPLAFILPNKELI